MYKSIEANHSMEVRSATRSFRVNTPLGYCLVETDQFTEVAVVGCQTFHAPPAAPYKRIKISVPQDNLINTDFWYVGGNVPLPEITTPVRDNGSVGAISTAPRVATMSSVLVSDAAEELLGSPTWLVGVNTYSYFIQNLAPSPTLISIYDTINEGNSVLVPAAGGILGITTRYPLYAKHRAGAGVDVSPANLRYLVTIG